MDSYLHEYKYSLRLYLWNMQQIQYHQDHKTGHMSLRNNENYIKFCQRLLPIEPYAC